jgi:hypothetical protein
MAKEQAEALAAYRRRGALVAAWDDYDFEPITAQQYETAHSAACVHDNEALHAIFAPIRALATLFGEPVIHEINERFNRYNEAKLEHENLMAQRIQTLEAEVTHLEDDIKKKGKTT